MDAPLSLNDMDNLLTYYFGTSKIKWFDAGLKLGLNQDTLDTIQKLHHCEEDQCNDLLKQLVNEPQPPTLRDVLDLLKPPQQFSAGTKDPQPPKVIITEQSLTNAQMPKNAMKSPAIVGYPLSVSEQTNAQSARNHQQPSNGVAMISKPPPDAKGASTCTPAGV